MSMRWEEAIKGLERLANSYEEAAGEVQTAASILTDTSAADVAGRLYEEATGELERLRGEFVKVAGVVGEAARKLWEDDVAAAAGLLYDVSSELDTLIGDQSGAAREAASWAAVALARINKDEKGEK